MKHLNAHQCNVVTSAFFVLATVLFSIYVNPMTCWFDPLMAIVNMAVVNGFIMAVPTAMVHWLISRGNVAEAAAKKEISDLEWVAMMNAPTTQQLQEQLATIMGEHRFGHSPEVQLDHLKEKAVRVWAIIDNTNDTIVIEHGHRCLASIEGYIARMQDTLEFYKVTRTAAERLQRNMEELKRLC